MVLRSIRPADHSIRPADHSIRPDGRSIRPDDLQRRAADSSVRTAIVALVAALCSVAAHASNDDASQLFQAARRAFEAHDYAAALEGFEAAAAGGLAGPAVHFNIGVVAFRLGRYNRAEAAFREAARVPQMAAVAHYNLGLVALRRGDSRAAARWFSRAEREAADERLRDLASTQLAGMLPRPANRAWVGYASLGAGYDDNVALVSNSDVLGVSGTDDGFAEVQLAMSAPLGRPWRVDAGLVTVDYQDLDRFDQLNLSGGGRYRLDMADWTGELGLQLAYTMLDGESFESRRILSLQSGTALGSDWRLRTRYRFSDIDGLNEFSGLSGLRHEAQGRIDWDREPWRVGVGYQFDVSDYDDDMLSATRHEIGIDLRRAFRGGWALALEASRRHSRYDIEDNGAEDRSELVLAISRPLIRRWRLVVRYAYADNDADRAEYDYQRSRITASVEAIM